MDLRKQEIMKLLIAVCRLHTAITRPTVEMWAVVVVWIDGAVVISAAEAAVWWQVPVHVVKCSATRAQASGEILPVSDGQNATQFC